MPSKRYESTEVDRRTWLHVPSGTLMCTSSDTHQAVDINQSSEDAEGECFPFFQVFNDREFKYRNRMHLLLSNHD